MSEGEIKGSVGVKRAAAALGVSARTVWDLIERKELASYRIGKRVLVRVGDLETFMATKVKAAAKEGAA